MRIDQLRVDIDHLNASIRALNDKLNGLWGLWEPQVRDSHIKGMTLYLTLLRSATWRP